MIKTAFLTIAVDFDSDKHEAAAVATDLTNAANAGLSVFQAALEERYSNLEVDVLVSEPPNLHVSKEEAFDRIKALLAAETWEDHHEDLLSKISLWVNEASP